MDEPLNPYASPDISDLEDDDEIPAGRHGTARLRPYISPRPLAWLVAIPLAMLAMNSLISLVHILAINWNSGGDHAEGPVATLFFALIGLLSIVLLLAIPVLFCCWLYRTHANLPALGVQQLRFTSRGAVGWFFVPGANFIMPYFVLCEIWRGTSAGQGYDVSSEERVDWAIQAWWCAWIIQGLTLVALFLIGFNHPGAVPRLVTAVNLLGAVLTTNLCVLAILVIQGLTKLQDQQMEDDEN